MDFAPAPGDRRAIRYGLSAVRNVGERRRCSRSSRRARTEGAFTSFADFCRKVEPARAHEARARVARSSPARSTRSGTPAAAWPLVGAAATRRCRRRSSPSARPRPPASSRCSAASDGAGVAEVDESRARRARSSTSELLLSKEKEMLGQFVTDHPLLGGGGHSSPRRRPREIVELEDRGDGELVDGRRDHRRASPASTRSAASRTRSSGWRASPAASRSSRSRASTRPCPI